MRASRTFVPSSVRKGFVPAPSEGSWKLVLVATWLVTTADGQHCFCLAAACGRTPATRSAQPGGTGCADTRACGRM